MFRALGTSRGKMAPMLRGMLADDDNNNNDQDDKDDLQDNDGDNAWVRVEPEQN